MVATDVAGKRNNVALVRVGDQSLCVSKYINFVCGISEYGCFSAVLVFTSEQGRVAVSGPSALVRRKFQGSSSFFFENKLFTYA